MQTPMLLHCWSCSYSRIMAVCSVEILILFAVVSFSFSIENEPIGSKSYDIVDKMAKVECKIEKWEKEREVFQETVLSVLEHRKEEMQRSFNIQSENLKKMHGDYEEMRNEITNKTEFPVHGGWGEWEEWSPCSTSCDMGLQSRTRNCSNPVPERNGHQCFGHNYDVKQCMLGHCANGGWSNWGNWNPCSVTCGVGVRSKSRSCSNPHPSPYGQYCVGEHFELQSCVTPECVRTHCTPNPCVHGRCYDVTNDYLCVCSHGYEGQNCNVSIDYCTSSPCLKGTCVNNGVNFICVCPPGFAGRTCEKIPASDCYDILQMNLGSRNGVYGVYLWKSRQYLEVLCDLETTGGGWTVFQMRFDGSVDFYKDFANYKAGFGNINGEFWLGLEHIYEMVSHGQSELRIDLMAADGTTAYEVFQNFSLSPGSKYTLHIGKGSGTAGDINGLSYHNGRNFFTYDQDNSNACASSKQDHGGWWYGDCAHANLNGQYVTPGTRRPVKAEGGMIYRDFKVTNH